MPDNTLHFGDNPWRRLPHTKPFVLPEDKEAVKAFNDQASEKYKLRTEDILPEPFLGDPKAPVVLLSNNPGVGKGADYKKERIFMERMRRNLLHDPSDYPFIPLDPDYPFVPLDPTFSGSGKWWMRKLKGLLERFDRQVVAQSILNVPYFPYPSLQYKPGCCPLPSQAYSFRLVLEAVNRKAVIVLMRKRAPWLTAVRELDGYGRLYQVKNWQNPAISRRNCEHFEEIAQAIEGRRSTQC